MGKSVENKRGRAIHGPFQRMRWVSTCGCWCVERTVIDGYGTRWVGMKYRTLTHYDGAKHQGWGWADGHPVRYRTRQAAERAVDRAALVGLLHQIGGW